MFNPMLFMLYIVIMANNYNVKKINQMLNHENRLVV